MQRDRQTERDGWLGMCGGKTSTTQNNKDNVREENKEINKAFMADIQIKLDGEGIREQSQPSYLTVKQETAAVGIRLAPLKNRH